jgi:hypothetical protein
VKLAILFTVMAGRVPAIHVLLIVYAEKTWMPGSSPGMTNGNIVLD